MAKNLEPDNEEPLSPTAVDDKSNKIHKLKKIAIIVVPIIIVIAAGVFFFLNVLSVSKNPKGEGRLTKQKEHLELDQNTYLDLDPMTISLISSGDKREFLRIALTLRLGSETESQAVLAKIPVIKDVMIGFLKSLRATDFNSSNSTIFLKEEIIKRLNKITAPIIIKEVLFQEITVQ
jgi:flagellar basal body-associated protein FliL